MRSCILLTICVAATFAAINPQERLYISLPFLPATGNVLTTVDGWGMFNLGTDVQKIIFTLSNKVNGYKDQVLTPGDESSFRQSTWDRKQKTIVVIHGYAEDGSGTLISNTKKIVTAYANARRPENLVFVDWHALSRQLNYFDSAKNVEKVGLRVAEFLIYLKGQGYIQSLEDVRLVGFSLGGHVAGTAAHFAGQALGEKVSRITGLDPAGPGFANKPDEYRLDEGDATFVEVIHTNMGDFMTSFGTLRVSGHVDFYPNGGKHQPGCSAPLVGEFLILGVCSHLKAIDYFANSIAEKVYSSCPCQDYNKFKNGGCACANPVKMGEFVDQRATGQYYVTIPLGQ